MMEQATIQDLFIYPIKSLGGARLESAQLEAKGLRHDRRWMLVDEQQRHVTQREFPTLSLLSVSVKNDQVKIQHKHSAEVRLQFDAQLRTELMDVTVWKDSCQAWEVSKEISDWFSQYLQTPVKLVGQFEQDDRTLENIFNVEGAVSFADEAPLLVVSQESLDDLNSKLDTPLPMDRFRPNIVLVGASAYTEDELPVIKGEDYQLQVLGKTARCVVTTTNQETAEVGKEPLVTLNQYRNEGGKVYFGAHAYATKTGSVKIGEKVQIIHRSTH